jgi:class 3 adenylate cyclase/tetratricopeptide (TPR) repeat protein
MITCSACSAENPGGFKFCGQCGAALAGPSAHPEERKVVTTLFCDLVGFTALSERVDPEDIDALLRRYSETARRIVESYGGTVEKFIGDAVVGVFGVPAAHEDDPERAVRAALRLVEALEGMTRPDGSPMEARVGVNTGEALVRLDVTPGSGEGFLTGDAVNVAARLQAAAPSGGVVMGESTFNATGRAFACEPLAPIAAKGKSAPVAAWLATAPISRVGTVGDRVRLTPLVGREVELAYVKALFDKALATSSPQFALIIGEPGIGKSRLVAELLAYVDARPELITWRQGRCLSYGEGVTFWALADVVKAHAGILETDDSAVAAVKLDAVVPDGPDRPWMANRLRALIGLEAPPAGRDENFAAWLRFIEQLALSAPLVLVFEDLHWADEGLLAFIEHLATHADAVPLLVIATARAELFEQHPTFAAGSTHLNRISLESLTRAETERLVNGLVGGAEVLGPRVADIVAHCEGNPFFAEESARLLTDRVQSAPVPASVQAVIAARLDALPPDRKAVLGDAAVVGAVFWNGAVAALGQRDQDEVDAALRDLVAKQLVRRVRESSMRGENEFAFAHALARDVAYGQLPRAARARKHAAAAAWIEGKAGERVEDSAEVLVHHSLTALDLARAIGDVGLAQSLAEPAVRNLALAGDRAINLDVVAAERHYARALELLGETSSKRPRLLVSWAEALKQSSRYREADDALERAVAGLKAAADIRAAAEAMMRLAVVRATLGDPGAHELRLEAVALLDGDGPSPEMVAVLCSLGGSLVAVKAQHSAAIEVLGRAIAMSEQLGLSQAAQALGMRAAARCDLGDAGGLDDYQRAFAAAEAQGLGPDLCRLYANYAWSISTFEGPPAALGAVRKGLELAGRRGLQANVLELRVVLCIFLIEAGAWDEALARAAEDTPALEEAEDVWSLLELRAAQALLFARRGDPDKAEPFLAWMVEKSREMGSFWVVIECLVAAAAVRFGRGETGAALDLLDEWATMPRTYDSPGNVERVPEAMRMAIAGGNRVLAASFVEGMASRFPVEENVLASAHALLTEHRGEHGEAAAGFAGAAARWHDFGVPYEEGHALLGQGRCLVALGRAPEAAARLAAAREIFARLGARPALAETEAVLAQAVPRTPA